MEGKHLVIIHFINVVTGKYQKVFRIILIYKINVLGNRVGCSAIYVESGVCFLTRRKYIYTAVLGIQSPASASCYITIQKNGFVLSQYSDNVHSAVSAVAEREINNAVFSAI